MNKTFRTITLMLLFFGLETESPALTKNSPPPDESTKGAYSVPFTPHPISPKLTRWWEVTLEREKVTPESFTDSFEPFIKDKWVILEVKDMEFQDHQPASMYYVSDHHSMQANASAANKNDPTKVIYKTYWKKVKNKKVVARGNLKLGKDRNTIKGHHQIIHMDLNDNAYVTAEYRVKGKRLKKP